MALLLQKKTCRFSRCIFFFSQSLCYTYQFPKLQFAIKIFHWIKFTTLFNDFLNKKFKIR